MSMLLALACVAGLSVADTDSPHQAEDALLAYRRAIGSINVIWRQELFAFPDDNRQLVVSRQTTFWLEGDCVRVDVEFPELPGRPAHREINGINVQEDGLLFRYSEEEFVDKQHFDATFFTSEKPEDRESRRAVPWLVDPRLLGLYPTHSATLVHHTFDSFLGRRDREEFIVESAEWKGRECLVLRFRWLQGSGVDCQVWIVPELGPNPVRIEAKRRGRRSKWLTDVIEVDYAQSRHTQVWYPANYTHRRFEGPKLIEEEIVAAEVVALNERLDPSVFLLSGMGIAPGTRVHGLKQDHDKIYEWDGVDVVQIDVDPPELPLIREPLQKREAGDNIVDYRLLLLVNAAILALAATYCVFRFLRRRVQ